MCDDLTSGDDAGKLSRRDFGALSVGAALAGYAASVGAAVAATALTETKVTIKTTDGMADAVLVHPAKGAYPGVVLWPDIGGLRDVFLMMARRLAAAGFTVLAVNQYYRSAPAPVLASFSEWTTPAGKAKLQPMIAALSPAGTTADAGAFIAFLDTQAAVDKKSGIGSHGYCMGGPNTIRAAVAMPGRVRAAASLHGGNLIGDAPDSPVNLIARTRASYLFAIARNDDARSPTDKDRLKAATAAAGRPATVEVFDGDHGWTVADSPTYNQPEAERAWTAMMTLFKTL